MHHVGRPEVPVAGGGTGGGQQIEQFVVRGTTDRGGQRGGEVGEGRLVRRLRGEGA